MLIQLNNRDMATRFRGLLPVIIDVETSGVDPSRAALLEIAAIVLGLNESGQLFKKTSCSFQIEAFENAFIDPISLDITRIIPEQPLRYAVPEGQALRWLFNKVKQELLVTGCQRAVLVGHNAWFDLAFLLQACKRAQITEHPFHSFTTFDTATLSAVMLGETVLARACRKMNIHFDVAKAHSAIYDADRTAELFCQLTRCIDNCR